jgi:site-specific DNA recombinase
MPEVLQQMLNYVIAIYIRLSAEDGDLSDEKNESNSVVNQRAYIRRFIELRPEFAGAQILEFCDDGYSGTNMERPAVRRLLEQVRQRKINCIIVKDYCAIIGLNQKDLENQGILAWSLLFLTENKGLSQ